MIVPPMVWIVLGCLVLPVAVLLATTLLLKRRLDQKAERLPTAEKLLRPAGESLRRKIDELTDHLDESLTFAVIVPAAISLLIVVSDPNGKITAVRLLTAFVVAACVSIFQARQLWRMVLERRDYRLGFHGERAVGEELNQLMLQGCRVFHDVPMEPYGNIDHVIVAPSGVYAVETKTRRKRKAPPGKREHEVIFDGKALEFPHCRDAHGLDQARQQADRLRVMLSKAVGEPVKVAPILTLPGWYVSSRVNAEIKVLNPKQIGKAILSRERTLSAQLIERIVYQLDQKCRDVEL